MTPHTVTTLMAIGSHTEFENYYSRFNYLKCCYIIVHYRIIHIEDIIDGKKPLPQRGCVLGI